MRASITVATVVVTDNETYDDTSDCHQHCSCKHCCWPCTSRAEECVDTLSPRTLNYSDTFVQSNCSLAYGQRSHLNTPTHMHVEAQTSNCSISMHSSNSPYELLTFDSHDCHSLNNHDALALRLKPSAPAKPSDVFHKVLLRRRGKRKSLISNTSSDSKIIEVDFQDVDRTSYSREGLCEQSSSSVQLIQQKSTQHTMKKRNKKKNVNHRKHPRHRALWLLLLLCVIIAVLTVLNGVVAGTTSKTFLGIAKKHVDSSFLIHGRSEYNNRQKRNPSLQIKTGATTVRKNLKIIDSPTTTVETIKAGTTNFYTSEKMDNTTSNPSFEVDAKPIEQNMTTTSTSTSTQIADSKLGAEKQTIAAKVHEHNSAASAALRNNLYKLPFVAQVDTTRRLSSVGESNNNNHNKNISHFVEFRRWIAIEDGEFEYIEKGRTHEIFRLYANRLHRIRLRCEVVLHGSYFPIPSDGNTPILTSIAWIRNNDEAKLIDAPHVAILELIFNATNPLKNNDYRCAATFILNAKVTPNKKETLALTKKDPGIINATDHDDNDSRTPTNATALSRAVKLIFFNDLGVYIVPTVQVTRTGGVASFSCRSNITHSEGMSHTWHWYIGERELHDCDDNCAIKIYSASSESLLHILRVDEDAHAGVYYCRLHMSATNGRNSLFGKSNAELRIDNSLDDDTKMALTSTESAAQQSHVEKERQLLIDGSETAPTAEVTRVDLRVDEQRHLECLYVGAVRVRWMRAENESQIDALLKQDNENMLAYGAIVGEETALSIDAQQISSTLGDYACVATDSRGRPLIRRKFTVLIKDDLFHEEDSFKTLTRRVGTPVKLNCATYRGERVQSVVWYREGHRFHFHPRSKLVITEKSDYMNSQLALSVVEPEDYGMYECVVIAADGGERWQSVYFRVEASTKERITRLHVDVDHVDACLHVKFRIPRTVGNLNDASQATYFLAYYPVDGSAPFNNEPFNGAQCHYDRKENNDDKDEQQLSEENNDGLKIIVDGEVVHEMHIGNTLNNDNIIFRTFDFTNDLVMPTGTTNYAIDCVLSPCADHNNHNFEAGIAYVFHVSMVLSSERLSITRLSAPLIANVWDAYVARALYFDVAYEIDQHKLVLRWTTPSSDELHGQLTGYEIDIAEDRPNGHATWKTEQLEINAREYHVNVSVSEREKIFSYRVRIVPKTRAGTPPKSHMYTASNFAFTVVDSQLFTPSRIDATLDISAPSSLEFRQIEPGVGRIRITWNTNRIKRAVSTLDTQYIVVKFAEALRHSQRRKLEKRSKRARMITRSILFQHGKLDIDDWLDVGYIYQVCAAIEIRQNSTIRRGFWRCARVSLFDEYGRLARIGDRPLPLPILCNDSISDGCKCEYLPSKNVLRIVWDSAMYKQFQVALNKSAFSTMEESDVYDLDATANDAFYVIHYAYDERDSNARNFSIMFNAIENAEFLTQVQHDISKSACPSMNAAYGFADLPLMTSQNQIECSSSPKLSLKLFPATTYRIMIEAQNIEHNGIASTYFTCQIPATAMFPPPDKFRATYNLAQKQVVFEWQPLQIPSSSALLKDKPTIDGYTIFLRNASKENDILSTSTLHENALRHYFVNGANIGKFILPETIINGSSFVTWITTHTSNEGDVIPSVPFRLDVIELWSPELVPPPSPKTFHAPTHTLFWQRIFLATAAALFIIFLLVCGTSLCLLAQIRKTQQLEKRKFNEENEELKRKFFGLQDVDINNAKEPSTATDGICTRLLSRLRTCRVDIKVETGAKSEILDRASLSSSPLLTRCNYDAVEATVINVEMMSTTGYDGADDSELLFQNLYAVNDQLDGAKYQDHVQPLLIISDHHDKEIPCTEKVFFSERDTKGGIDGCHPAGSRLFRQRMEQDSVFRHICLQAARRLASQMPSLANNDVPAGDSGDSADEIILSSSSRASTYSGLSARITNAWQRWGVPRRAASIRINASNTNARESLLRKSTSCEVSDMMPAAVVPLIVDMDKRKRQTSLNATSSWRNIPTSQMIVIEMAELQENHQPPFKSINDATPIKTVVALDDDKCSAAAERKQVYAIKQYSEQLSQKIVEDATKVATEKLSNKELDLFVKELVSEALHIVYNKINAAQEQIALCHTDDLNSNLQERCKSRNFSPTKTYAILIRPCRSLDNIATQRSHFDVVANVESTRNKRWIASRSNSNTAGHAHIILPLRSARSNDTLVKNQPSALFAMTTNWHCIVDVNMLPVGKEHTCAYPAKLFAPSMSTPAVVPPFLCAYSSASSTASNSKHDSPNKSLAIKQTNGCLHYQLPAQHSPKLSAELVDCDMSPTTLDQQSYGNLLLKNEEKFSSKQRNNFCHSKDVENANCISNIQNCQTYNASSGHSDNTNAVDALNNDINASAVINNDCARVTSLPNLSDSGIVYDLSHISGLQQIASNNHEQHTDMNIQELQYSDGNTHLLLNFAYINSNNNGNAFKFVEHPSIIKPYKSKCNGESVNGGINNCDTRNLQLMPAKNSTNKRDTNTTIEFRIAPANSTTVSQRKQPTLITSRCAAINTCLSDE